MRAYVFALLFSGACTASVDGGSCDEDADCGASETCLVDLDRDTSYCTSFCENDVDCPPAQTCRTGKRGPQTEVEALKYCVDRVRTCGDVELCNGFDDNCDGVVDEQGCQLITGCLDDAACDAWTCQAPVNQPLALCAPPNEAASREEFDRCTADDQCPNGLCDTGLCSSLCRPGTPCPSLDVNGRLRETFCAGAVGPGDRPPHNECQIVCAGPNDCFDDQSCVWRQVYQAGSQHEFVCSFLDDRLLPLGAPCPNNEPDGGDAMCQHGLCFQNICTRRCGGPGADCSDVSSDVVCVSKTLRYGSFEFGGEICARSN